MSVLVHLIYKIFKIAHSKALLFKLANKAVPWLNISRFMIVHSVVHCMVLKMRFIVSG
jgi:hypothetical protein